MILEERDDRGRGGADADRVAVRERPDRTGLDDPHRRRTCPRCPPGRARRPPPWAPRSRSRADPAHRLRAHVSHRLADRLVDVGRHDHDRHVRALVWSRCACSVRRRARAREARRGSRDRTPRWRRVGRRSRSASRRRVDRRRPSRSARAASPSTTNDRVADRRGIVGSIRRPFSSCWIELRRRSCGGCRSSGTRTPSPPWAPARTPRPATETRRRAPSATPRCSSACGHVPVEMDAVRRASRRAATRGIARIDAPSRVSPSRPKRWSSASGNAARTRGHARKSVDDALLPGQRAGEHDRRGPRRSRLAAAAARPGCRARCSRRAMGGRARRSGARCSRSRRTRSRRGGRRRARAAPSGSADARPSSAAK